MAKKNDVRMGCGHGWRSMCQGLCLLTMLQPAPLAAGNELDNYVGRADDSFAYEIVNRHDLGGVDAIVVKLTSQTWRGIVWKHWLSLLVPKHVTHRSGAILLIAGGSNGQAAPDPKSGKAAAFSAVAAQSGATLAICQQVPNQPLLGGLKEDALIAETFRRYLDSQAWIQGVESNVQNQESEVQSSADNAKTVDLGLRTLDATRSDSTDDWPLLLPMVKSAVRAMDAVQKIGREELDIEIERFVVTGASKRGWTTWLTAAVDPRVCAIAPMVIDVLNFGPQMQQHQQSYGGASAKIGDYVERGVLERLDTKLGRRLCGIVDPFVYRNRFTMPKLIILGTNDPYWTVDSANLYFSDLSGEKHLLYLPNAGHGLGPDILPTLTAFINASLQGESLARVDFQENDDDTITVRCEEPNATATQWTAHSTTRDFRGATWQAHSLPDAGHWIVKLRAPEHGYSAHFIQVQFQSPAAPFPCQLSSPMTVLPKARPPAERTFINK